MLGSGGAHPSRDLRLPEAGLEYPEIARHVRGIVNRMRAQGCNETWMIVCDGELVGLCGYKGLPSAGSVEIAYNIAPSRQRRGHATRAVAQILSAAYRDNGVERITAATLTSNIPSQRVLQANGFEPYGRDRDEEGELVLWQAFTK